jgi:hypothetical protein
MSQQSQAPTGSQLVVSARFARDHFVPGSNFVYARRAKSASGFVAKRPRERNENQDASAQMIRGINSKADIQPKFEIQPDVDSIVPFRAAHCGRYAIGAPVGTTIGAGTITTNGTTAIVGVGTAFLSAIAVGDVIFIAGETARVVTVVTDDTHLTLSVAAATNTAGNAYSFAKKAVYPWSFRPQEPVDAAPPSYVGSMDFEITDGDGFPVAIYEMAQQDLEVKIADGKITSITEGWFGCLDTYMSEASVVKTAATYTGNPSLFGHISAANAVAAKLPFRAKVTNAAGAGFDGKMKFAQNRLLTGTLATNGTTAIVGTGTLFTAELVVGDSIYIFGEGVRTIAAIADNTHLTLNAAAVTAAPGLVANAATFSGNALPFLFDIGLRVVLGNGTSLGISRFEDFWIIFPSGAGVVSVNDEFSFTTPRTLAAPVYSSRNVLHAAGVEVVIDGQPYGGVPGQSGFHSITMKLTNPKKQNFTTGGKYSQGNQRNGRWMATISFDRDRNDRRFLEKLIAASSLSITVSMYGDPFMLGVDELWQFTFANCEIADDIRDVATENTLPEKIDVNAVRGEDGTPIFTELIYSTRASL